MATSTIGNRVGTNGGLSKLQWTTIGRTSDVLAIANLMREIIRRAALWGDFGLWLSLVERLVRDEEAVGSNPTSPTEPLSVRGIRKTVLAPRKVGYGASLLSSGR